MTMGWETVTPVSTNGAAAVIWALDYLHRIGATGVAQDFRPVLPKLLERTIPAFENNSPTPRGNSEPRGSDGERLRCLDYAAWARSIGNVAFFPGVYCARKTQLRSTTAATSNSA